MEHYGLYAGIFLDGRQVGACRRWKVTQEPIYSPDSKGPASSNPAVLIMSGWKARALSYRFEEGTKGKELEFRFATEFMYFKTRGKVTTPDVKVGVNAAEEITMEGGAPLEAVFPRSA